MKRFSHIESWASNIGYVVEKSEIPGDQNYIWYKEKTLEFHVCSATEEVIEQILLEIKESYAGDF